MHLEIAFVLLCSVGYLQQGNKVLTCVDNWNVWVVITGYVERETGLENSSKPPFCTETYEQYFYTMEDCHSSKKKNQSCLFYIAILNLNCGKINKHSYIVDKSISIHLNLHYVYNTTISQWSSLVSMCYEKVMINNFYRIILSSYRM